MPTAAGKSLVIAYFIHEMFMKWPDSRVMVLTHVKELLEQNCLELKGIWPDAPTSFWSAGIGEKKLSRIIFAGIASVYRRAAEMGFIELLIIDEAHLVPGRGYGMYRRFIAEMKKLNPHLKVIGLTATPFRLDYGMLIDGKHIFTHHCYETDMKSLIDDGYLLPLRAKAPDGQIDMSGVHIVGHEFVASEMEDAAMKVVDAAVDEVVRLGVDRGSWLLFCSGVAHAEVVKTKLLERGIDTEVITHKTPKASREATIKRFRAGDLRALVNIGTLTTGFNAPRLDLIALLRATMSTGLYVQMLGRGMRVSPETAKRDCLILDFGGNVARHGPIDQVQVTVKQRKPGKKKNVTPVKTCPVCQALVATALRECPDCGFNFPFDASPNHEETAAAKTILSWEKVRDICTLNVSAVSYSHHLGKSGKPSLRVTYHCGLRTVHEYVCIGHQGYPGLKALNWWSQRAPSGYVPETVSEAEKQSSSLITPDTIRVDFTDDWPKILFHQMPPPKVTSAMLQSSALAAAKKIGVPKVHQIVAKYGADLVSQVPSQNHIALYSELIAK